jgi:hypothetical protein
VSEKAEIVAWLVYILVGVVCLLTGVLGYNYLPDQRYDEGKHELLESHLDSPDEGPRSGQAYEIPDKWQNVETGKVFTPDQFAAHSRSEARRLGIAIFAYGLIGCLLYGYIRYRRYAGNFFESFGKAVIVNLLVAIVVSWITWHLR